MGIGHDDGTRRLREWEEVHNILKPSEISDGKAYCRCWHNTQNSPSEISDGKASCRCCPDTQKSQPGLIKQKSTPKSKPKGVKWKQPTKTGEPSTTIEIQHEDSIDIDKLVKYVNDKLAMVKPLSDSCCIYRVPAQFREMNQLAYSPRIVSIGPFHHGKKDLEPMEDHKRRYFQHFLARKELVNKSLKDLFECAIKWERRLRDSYAETIDQMGSEEFLEMVLVDATFIVEYLLKRYLTDWKDNDRIFDNQRLTNIVRFDILLIENQIPYFFLKKLFSFWSINDHRQEKVSMKDLVNRFLEDSVRWDWLVEDDREVQHLVHFLQVGLQKSDLLTNEEAVATMYDGRAAPTISNLHRAGVKFKLNSTSKSLLDIKFHEGILEIPKWRINDHTQTLFRNIQAFEHCQYSENSLTNYIAIMDFLVNTPEDVELLIQNGIIENWLMDNHTAAALINRLGAHNLIRQDDFCFSKLIIELDQYYKDPWHNWKANLKQKYFSNPWSVISLIAAAFLLLLALVQTVCTILPLV